MAEAMEPRLLLSAAPTLAITEINYKPYAPSPAEQANAWGSSDFEFIEIQNIGDAAVDISTLKLTLPVVYDFAMSPIKSLAPGQYVVVSPNPSAFVERYGTGLPMVGAATGHLPNAGSETKLVYGADQATVLDFAYSSSGQWPGRANGDGATLELKNPFGTTPDQYGDPNMWRSSVAFNGTPGAAPMPNPNDLVIDEVLSDAGVAGRDFIEIRNVTTHAVDLTGMYLSDDLANYLKFRIPDGTTVPANGRVVFWQGHYEGDQYVVGSGEFGGQSANSITLSPTLGNELWLMGTDGSGKVTRFVDHVKFAAAENNQSVARWPDGAGGLYPATTPTPGAANSGPRVGPVVISEIMYDSPGGAALEYIEVHNPTAAAVDLSNWQLGGDVSFWFPGGTTLRAGDSLLVVPFDPSLAYQLTAFQTAYGLAPTVAVLGPLNGAMGTGGGTIDLYRALPPPVGDPSLTPYALEDQVIYDNKSPWPTEAHGTGLSLTRKAYTLFGDFGQDWTAALPTPGSPGAPTDIALSNNSVTENRPAGTVMGRLSASDPDPKDRFTYALVAGDGAQDNALFAVSGSVLKTARPLNYEAQATYSIRLRVKDLEGATFEKVLTVTATNVAEPPAVAVPGSQIAREDTDLVFSSAIGNAVVLSDPEVGQQNVSVTLQATHGAIILATQNNLTVAGDGTAQVVLTGLVADINAAMDGMAFHPAQDYHAAAAITVLANDLGNNVSGSALTDSARVAVTVRAANDAPSFAPGGDQVVDEDAPAQKVVAWATGISPGPADEAGQKVTFLVANDNHALFAVQPYLLANGTLGYTVASNASGVATVTVMARDNGGTANGGADTSALRQFTITVSPVNDAPVAQPQSATTPGDSDVVLTLGTTDLETAYGDLVFHVPAATDHGGSLVEVSHGQYRYTPAAGYLGPDTFQFTVTDNGDPAGSDANPGDLTSAAATVRIGVGNVIRFDARHPAAPFHDASGDLVSLSLSGPGYGEAYLPDVGSFDMSLLVLEQTTAGSSVIVRVAPAQRGLVPATAIGGVLVHGSLNKLAAPAASLQGDLLADGGIASLTLADATDGRIEINTAALVTNPRQQVAMKLGHLTDVSVDTHGVPIGTLSATDWLNSAATPLALSAPRLGTLSVQGELANLDIGVDGVIGMIRALRFGSGSVQADSLGTLSILGRDRGGIPPIFGDLGATVTLLGQHLAVGKKVLGAATIVGQLDADMSLHGNAGTLVLGSIRAALVIDGNATSVRIAEPLVSALPVGGPAGRLHVGGTARVTANGQTITQFSGDLYPDNGVT